MNSIKILTFNIPFFPDDVKVISSIDVNNVEDLTDSFTGEEAGLTGKKERAAALIGKIKRMGVDQPDVITLQEIWENKYKREIRTKLEDIYPYSHLDLTKPGEALFDGALEGQVKYLNSGLMILSKYPILKTSSHTYENDVTIFEGSEDGLAMKGLIGVTLELPGDQEVHVFTTHLQSQRTTKASKAKIKQLEEAHDKIRKHTKHNGSAIILTGDFNLSDAKNPDTISEAKAVFSESTYFSEFYDTYDQARASRGADKALTASTWSSVKIYEANPSEDNIDGHHKIDHVWILNDKAGGYSFATAYFGEKLSDHLAEQAIIELLDPYRAANDLAEDVLPVVNQKIAHYIRNEGVDPWANVVSGANKLGEIKIAKNVKAQAKASYSIKDMKGLSSLEISSLIIDQLDLEDDPKQVSGTIFLTAQLKENISAKVSGKIQASAVGVKVKENISGTITAKQMTGHGNGVFSASLSFRKSCMHEAELTCFNLKYKNIDVRIKGLGTFNKLMAPLVDSLEELFTGHIKKEISSAVQKELNEALSDVLPLYGSPGGSVANIV
jgi:endonuclease/exonuclease/phosphatase family metal-dependent hydrolase